VALAAGFISPITVLLCPLGLTVRRPLCQSPRTTIFSSPPPLPGAPRRLFSPVQHRFNPNEIHSMSFLATTPLATLLDTLSSITSQTLQALHGDLQFDDGSKTRSRAQLFAARVAQIARVHAWPRDVGKGHPMPAIMSAFSFAGTRACHRLLLTPTTS